MLIHRVFHTHEMKIHVLAIGGEYDKKNITLHEYIKFYCPNM